MGGVIATHILTWRKYMSIRYFKKPSGKIVKYNFRTHNIESLEERFTECDAGGDKIQKVVEKETKKSSKKEGK